MDGKADILSYDLTQLTELVAQLGQKPFRARQIFDWLHQHRVHTFDEMTNLSAALRAQLNEHCFICAPQKVAEARSHDGTVKYLLEYADGARVETVAMQYEHGMSVCLSTQVGCRMGCTFCATGKSGFERSLTAGEILAELYAVCELSGTRADSIVLMGMGEPLDNYDAVMRFIDLACDEAGLNLSARSVTLSTCGLVPQIERLADEHRQLTLSVSLHATSDEKRSAMMPINKKWPLGELIPACRHYFDKTGRRLSFEYAVIAGTNNGEEDAVALAHIAKGVRAHINLIPVNPAADPNMRATRAQAEAFAARLRELGANATVRRTLGQDVDAACGQLRRREGLSKNSN